MTTFALNLVLAATAIFSRGQLKYGAQRDDFIHRWYERPLHQDTAFQDSDDRHWLNPAAWKKTAEVVRLGKMNGFAACLSQTRRDDVIGRSVMPGGEMQILVELPYSFGESAMGEYLTTIRRAHEMPNAFRLDGRVVLTRYPLIGEKQLPFFTQVRERARAEFGDRQIVLPYFTAYEKGDLDPDSPTAEQFERARERLRRILRGADGFVLSLQAAIRDRRFSMRHFETVELPLVRGVLDEPEFKGQKRLGILVRTGHENDYRWQYTHDSTGTEMLCSYLTAAERLKADFTLCVEWDEENENTHFRPTVSNGYTTQRILRLFADRFAGRAPEIFPGDDVSIPNLLLSYRKALTAGEEVEVEVRNVPDGTFAGEAFAVDFAWCDANGRVVREFPMQRLVADALANVWFKVPVADLIDERVLLPRLKVTWSGGTRQFAEGLWPLDLNAQRNIDQKWVKQALREVKSGMRGFLAVGEPDANGTYLVRGEVESETPLRTIEVLDDQDSAYVYAAQTAEPDGFTQFRIEYTGMGNNRPETHSMNGTVRIEGAPGAKLETGSAPNGRTIPAKGMSWTFRNVICNNWGGALLFRVPDGEVATARVTVDLPGFFSGTVPLADLLEKDRVGFNGTDCCGLVVSRYLPTGFLPRAANVRQARFSFRWKPLEKTSVLRLQVIGMDDRLWRGCPQTVYRPSGTKVAIDVYDRLRGETRVMSVDTNRLEELVADFDGSRGSVLWLGSGRALAGMTGGSAALSQGFGQAESHNGNPIARYLKPGMARATGWACLPQQVVPAYCGFTLEMDVVPSAFGRRQGLFGSGNCGLTLQIEPDGSLLALPALGNGYNRGKTSVQARVKGPKLVANQLNHIAFVTDRRTAWLEVNGVKGSPIAYADYFWNQRYGVLGGIHPTLDFFEGEIRSFAVKPRRSDR